ncbi:hypothetical protein [Gordonia aurantiaca]|uniref:hypothetical protein n=1 Tax=Gordonia sp. B21 TaxID=3151852 RepID=UPI0032670251
MTFGGGRIAGDTAAFVALPGSVAGAVVILGDDDRLVVTPEGAGVEVEAIRTLDLTRPWARARVDIDDSAARAPLPGGTASRYRDAVAVHRASTRWRPPRNCSIAPSNTPLSVSSSAV